MKLHFCEAIKIENLKERKEKKGLKENRNNKIGLQGLKKKKIF